MARSMPSLAAAAAMAAGGRRRLGEFNWQEPLGNAPIPPWSSWSRDTQNGVLFAVILVAVVLVAGVILWLLRRLAGNKDAELDVTCRVVPEPWSTNNDDNDNGNDNGDDDGGEAVSAPFPWQQQEQQQLPMPSTSWNENEDDGHPPVSTDGGEGGSRGRPPRRQRRRRRQQQQQQPAATVPEVLMLMAMAGVELTPASVQWVLANFDMPPVPVPLPPATTTTTDDVETAAAAPAVVEEEAEMETMEEPEPEPEPEPPAPTLQCRFSTAEGWAEGTCSVCLTELVDGDRVRVLTACMHCFHATCVEKWLRENATCPLCRAPTIAVPARGRRRRRQQQNQIVMTAAPADPDVSLAY